MAEKRKPVYNPEVRKEGAEEGKEEKEPKEIDESGKPEPLKTKTGEETGEDDAGKEKDKDEDIPLRNSASQIIARKNRTIEKLRSKSEEDEGADYVPPTGGADDEELTPEAQTAVQKEIKRQISPLMEGMANKSDEDELQDLFTSDPNSKGYEKQIRAYMKVHPTATPGMIFHHLAFDEAETTGSKRKKAADTDADNQRGGGTSVRPVDQLEGGLPSVEEQGDMSDEEFEALQHKARAGDFVPKE